MSGPPRWMLCICTCAYTLPLRSSRILLLHSTRSNTHCTALSRHFVNKIRHRHSASNHQALDPSTRSFVLAPCHLRRATALGVPRVHRHPSSITLLASRPATRTHARPSSATPYPDFDRDKFGLLSSACPPP